MKEKDMTNERNKINDQELLLARTVHFSVHYEYLKYCFLSMPVFISLYLTIVIWDNTGIIKSGYSKISIHKLKR